MKKVHLWASVLVAASMTVTSAIWWFPTLTSGATGDISTVAGSGGSGTFSGDAGAATSAKLNSPSTVAVDSSGNIYIADTGNHRIRKVNASDGKINTIAGTGSPGNTGDNGLAVNATLQKPTGIDVDGQGNVYFVQFAASSVARKIATSGTITRVAGTGSAGNGIGSDGDPATSVPLNWPTGVSVDRAGNVYITDFGSAKIRRVDAATQTVTTLAGNGADGYTGDNGPAAIAQLDGPNGLDAADDGNLYIADTDNHRIRTIASAVVGTTTTVASTSTTVVPNPVVPRKGGLTARFLALHLKLTVPKGSSVSISVSSASKKICAVKKARLVSLKAGNCKFSVTVKPRKGKSQKRSGVLKAV